MGFLGRVAKAMVREGAVMTAIAAGEKIGKAIGRRIGEKINPPGELVDDPRLAQEIAARQKSRAKRPAKKI